MLRIRLEAAKVPHRAYYDFQQFIKYWPSEKKKLDDVMLKIKQCPDAEQLAKLFSRTMIWSDPGFVCKNAGEAKKIVAELKKMKPLLEKLKDSKVVEVQDGAHRLDGRVDEPIATIPDRIPAK